MLRQLLVALPVSTAFVGALAGAAALVGLIVGDPPTTAFAATGSRRCRLLLQDFQGPE